MAERRAFLPLMSSNWKKIWAWSLPQVLKINFKITDLNAGVGDPCAAQDKLNGSLKVLLIVELDCSTGNFGADPPTGSRIIFIVLQTDLNAGTGDPWAGQEREKGWTTERSKVRPLISIENLGAEPPTGSE